MEHCADSATNSAMPPTMIEIAPNVFVETGFQRVVVGAVLTAAGWLCIDTPPLPADARAWLISLQAISDQPVRYVINTDGHRDRILTCALFDAPVIAHEAAARPLFGLGRNFMAQSASELTGDEQTFLQIANTRFTPPQITYSTSLYVEIGGRELVLLSQPSACAGSAWVALPEERVLFVGDTVCLNQPPFIQDGCTAQWLEALRRLQDGTYAGWTIVSGRDGVISPAALGPLVEVLEAAQAGVAELVEASGTRADVAALVGGLMARYPAYVGRERAQAERRLLAGLEAMFDGLNGASHA